MALVKTITKVEPIEKSDFLHEALEANDFVICKSPDKLKLLLDTLSQEKQLHFISDGDWSMHDLVTELLNKFSPADIFITTYAIREFAVRQLLMALEKKLLLSVTMILDARAKTRTPEVYQLASHNFSRIRLTEIHAKVTVIRSAKGSVTIVGSANYTSNPRIEAGVITLDEAAANFHINWIDKTCDHAQIFE